MSITALSNELLMKNILERFVTQELIPLRLVSSHWCSCIEQICGQKKTIKIFDCRDDISCYLSRLFHVAPENVDYWSVKSAQNVDHNSDLIVLNGCFQEPVCAFVYRLFPNVQHLMIYSEVNAAFCGLPNLLRLYNGTLIGLSLMGSFKPIRNKSNGNWKKPLEHSKRNSVQMDILKAIGEMDSLRRLHLLVNDLFFDLFENGYIEEITLTEFIERHLSRVLPRLEHFSLFNQYRFKYNPNHGITPHLLGAGDSYNAIKLSPNLTHITLVKIPSSCIAWSRLANLRSLNLHFVFRSWASLKVSVQYLNKHIQHLPNLAELTLHNINHNLDLSRFLATDQLNRPIESITHLNLCEVNVLSLNSNLDGKNFCAQLSTCFPNVQHLTVSYYLYIFDGDDDEKDNVEALIKPHLGLFLHLRSYKFNEMRQCFHSFVAQHLGRLDWKRFAK